MTVWRAQPPGHDPRRRGRAVFLDRDGVVIADRHYLADPAEVVLLPGVADAMRRLAGDGFWLIGLSNQSGLGRGYFTVEDHAAVMNRLDDLLAAAGTGFDGFFYCPHAPEDGCACRKPARGLLDEAARHFRYDAAASWVIGDKPSDVELGLAAGLRAVMVRTGHGREHEDAFARRWSGRRDVLLLDDLPQAAMAILSATPPETAP